MAVSAQEKREVVRLMESGLCGRAALDAVGVAVTETTAYQWRQKWQAGGPEALVDQRHGYRYKMTDEIRTWLRTYCQAAPQTTSTQLKKEMKERFGVEVSKGHVNLLRTQLGVSRPKKTLKA